MTDALPFDSRQLRSALGAFTTGVTVVTTVDADGNRHGVTANSFSSVSLDPPLILWSQSLTSRSYPAFSNSDRFAVNIMAHDQVHISNQFAKSGGDKFQGVTTSDGIGGVPIIMGSAAHLECVKVAAWPGGDHVVYLGRVERIHRAPRRVLAFGDGRYMSTFAHELGGSIDVGRSDGYLGTIDAARLASASLSDICEQVGDHTVGVSVWGNLGPTIVRWEPSRRPVSEQLQTGVVVQLTQTATGVAYSAFLAPGVVEPVLDQELARNALEQGPDRAMHAAQVEDARLHGMARMVGEVPSERHQAMVNAFTAPVLNARGEMVLALTMVNRSSILSSDWTDESAQALGAAARHLSASLGYQDSAHG